jgi:branched-chain amino acid aminotransferase
MNECLHDTFILNDKIKRRKDFNESHLNTGKSFYEVLRYIDGCCLFLEDHLERITNSIRLFNIDYSIDYRYITESLSKLILNNRVKRGNVKLVISFNESLKNKPNILAYFTKYKYPGITQYKHGINVSLLSLERKMPNAKFVNNYVITAVKSELLGKGFYETLLVDKKGHITEGSKSNVFFLKDNEICTPPINKVLPGITRKYVLQICNRLNIRLIEKDISINNLRNYDSVFLSGTSAKILPVKGINDVFFKVNNKLLKQIIESYENIIIEYISKRRKNKIEIINTCLSTI